MKIKLCVLAVLSTLSLPALAADQEIMVKGTIKPVACELHLPAGDTIDYGNIDPLELSVTDYYLLPEKQIDITVSCEGLTIVGLMAVNSRPGSMAGVATEGPSYSARAPIPLFGKATTDGVGLGMDGSKKIGGYAIRLDPVTTKVDGKTVDMIAKGASGSKWAINVPGSLYLATEARHLTWALPGSTSPLAFKDMTGKIAVQAYINKKPELDLSKDIKIDGATTLELVYL